MGKELLITELSTTVLTERNEVLCKYQEFFPMIGTPAFAINLKKLFSVVEGGVEKGLVFNHRLTGKFSSIAKYDFSILVYSNYQREGIGRRVVDLILSLDAGAVFIVPKSNVKSLSFFRTLNNLSHVTNGNLFVFNRS